MEDAGQKLKRVREGLNLRYRDVEEASLRIAEAHKNDEFAIALSRLADIENKGTVPSIYRLYTLSAIYRLDFLELLEWYDVNVGNLPADAARTPLEAWCFEVAAARRALVEHLRVASLDDLIRMKRAAGRPQDRIAIEWLSALRDELQG